MFPDVDAEDRDACRPSSGCPGSACSRPTACRPTATSQTQPLPKRPAPPLFICSLNVSKLPNAPLIASAIAPVGAPPLPGPMICQNIV